MFPTLGDLFNYLFGTHWVIPIQTLGLFMALAFIFPYFVFRSEFRRKEADGKIHAFKETEVIGQPASVIELLVNGLLGFFFGYKILGGVLAYKLFLHEPKGFILSTHGSLIIGLLCGCGFAYWAYRDRKKAQLPEPKVVEKTVHPYQLMTKLVFSLGITGFIGAKLFDTVEHLDKLRYDPIGLIFSANGFTYYGGLIFGAITYLIIGYRRGMKLSHLADIGSPGMMLAYAVGRIGCQLSGDGDWGIVNMNAKPNWLTWLPDWMWSSKFPHNEINAGIPIKNCTGNFCTELVRGVYPTSFYEVIVCMAFFILMWAIRKHIYAAGLMFYIYLLLNGGERLLMETIRVNIKYHLLGISFTQAELIGFAMIIGGTIGILSIIYHRSRSKNKLQYT